MLTLCSKIRIGGAEFGGVHEVVVKRSIYELAATASIKVPVTAVFGAEGGVETPGRVGGAPDRGGRGGWAVVRG